MASLEAEIRDLIEGYFAKQGECVRISRARGGNRNDLSTWEVVTVDDSEEQLLAAE